MTAKGWANELIRRRCTCPGKSGEVWAEECWACTASVFQEAIAAERKACENLDIRDPTPEKRPRPMEVHAFQEAVRLYRAAIRARGET